MPAGAGRRCRGRRSAHGGDGCNGSGAILLSSVETKTGAEAEAETDSRVVSRAAAAISAAVVRVLGREQEAKAMWVAVRELRCQCAAG